MHGRELDRWGGAMLAEIGRDPPTMSDFSY
jgi:hypothetical protein